MKKTLIALTLVALTGCSTSLPQQACMTSGNSICLAKHPSDPVGLMNCQQNLNLQCLQNPNVTPTNLP